MNTSNTNHRDPTGLSQELSEKVARHFYLIFNQAIMYHGSHPTVASMVLPFLQLLKECPATVSPLTIMREKDSLYLEEWCVDKKLNRARMVNHFRTAGVQSISFFQGMTEVELLRFLEVFCNLKTYPTAELMKEGLARQNVNSIRLNYLIYKFKKVTVDEEVVAVGEEVLAELERSLSLQNLLENPFKFSQDLMGLSSAEPEDEAGMRPGRLIAQKLKQMGNDIQSFPLGAGSSTLENMIQAGYKMRAELLKAIETQKAMGVIFREEGLIRDAAQALTRQVIIRLIREEYNQGQISISRLAQIVRRMVPDLKELRFLLPELKEALLADGMPLHDFLKLVKELAGELQSEGLVQVLQEAVEEVGVSIEELILRIKEDPKSAAELIVLAAEIRNAGLKGDEKLLTELLVDYIERVGNHMALERARAEGIEGGKHLQELLSRIQMELVESLRGQPLKAEVVVSVDRQLSERIASTLGQLKQSWVLHQLSGDRKLMDAGQIVRALENTLENERELREILEPIKKTLQDQGMSESLLNQVYTDVYSRLEAKQKLQQWGDLPGNTLNRSMSLFLLDWEIQKARRHPGTFSAILIRVLEIIPVQRTRVTVDPNSPEIRNQVLEILRRSVRKVDIVGMLGENRVLLLLPMTPLNGARILLEKLLRILNRQDYKVQSMLARVEFGLTAIPFSRSRTPTVESFLDTAEKSLLRLIAAHTKTSNV